MSARARKVFEASSDGFELYSIDEMFDGFDAGSTRTLARTLHCNVRQLTAPRPHRRGALPCLLEHTVCEP